ncbi:glycosyl transferase [Brenneria tiliae]|uniref:Glycosyl transferase n=1 Tax=Brenneria tiliae TaxID=2914984 RepID=A0ABT0MUM7_9GAMM|nr:glycosyl transferase [Brenneria tiliae]MCL2893550.1 glycosyl transferase [Brenneria tiliae]
MNPIKLNAVVVLYNSKLEDSLTINSIFKSDLSGAEFKLLIWNNGKYLLDNNDIDNYINSCAQKGITSEIYQDTRNISLSKIYNYFIKKSDYEFISIFDQDTRINKCFFQNIIKNEDLDLICPEIYLSNKNNIKSSPVYNTARVNTDFVQLGNFNANAIFTCSSGLSFSSKLIHQILEKHGFIFNEQYAFYWIDHDFLERLKDFDFVKGKCIGKIYHDMSGAGIEFHSMKESAKLEHGYGKILRRINNDNKSNVIRNIIYAIKYALKSKCSIKSMLSIIQCALYKKHPRSKFKINNNIKPTHFYYRK